MTVLANSSINIANNKMLVVFLHFLQVIFQRTVEIILFCCTSRFSWGIDDGDCKLRITMECGSLYSLADGVNALQALVNVF